MDTNTKPAKVLQQTAPSHSLACRNSCFICSAASVWRGPSSTPCRTLLALQGDHAQQVICGQSNPRLLGLHSCPHMLQGGQAHKQSAADVSSSLHPKDHSCSPPCPSGTSCCKSMEAAALHPHVPTALHCPPCKLRLKLATDCIVEEAACTCSSSVLVICSAGRSCSASDQFK